MKPPTLAPADVTLRLLQRCADTAQRAVLARLPQTLANAAERLRADAEIEFHARSGRILFLTRTSELTQMVEAELAAELAACIQQFAALDKSNIELPRPEAMVHGLDAFELQLLLDRATYRHSDPAESQFQELGWRLSHLLNVHKVPPRANPLRAAVFFRAFARAFVRLDVFTPAVLPLLKSLDSPLATPLRKAYREVNFVLQEAGVAALQARLLPNPTAVGALIALSDKYTDQRTESVLNNDVTFIDAPPAAPAPAPEETEPSAGAAHAAAAGTPEEVALARSLASRMGYELIRFDAGYPPSISDIHKVTAGADAGKFVRIAIELVHTLFQSVVDDPAIPEEFLNLILYLQIPMLRTTLVHPGYVPTHKAPGQPLVRQLRTSSAGWTPAGEFNQRLLAAAQAAVRPLVAQPDAGPEQFHAALLRFMAFLADEEKAQDNPVERLRKAHAAAEERKASKARITIELGRKIETHSPPLYLRNFLLGTWVSVLHAARERAAAEPEFAAPFENLIDELLWSVQDRASPTDRAPMTATIPQLLATIYRGIGLIGMDPTDVQDLVANLMTSRAAAAVDPFPDTRGTG